MKNSWPEIGEDKQTKGLVFLIFLVLWMASRCYNIYPLLNSGEMGPRLSGADSYFHLRHARYVLENYPHVQRLDNMSAYPYLEKGLNQGFFDFAVATISKLSFGLLTPFTILLWNSPLLTGIGSILIGAWLWRQGGPWLCSIFMMLLLAYPGPLSQVAIYGNGDHHAFEVLLAALLALSLSTSFSPAKGPKHSVLAACILFIFYLSWPGAALHLFFVGICFFLVGLQQRASSAESGLLIQKSSAFALTLIVLLGLTHFVAPNYVIWWKAELVFLSGAVALLVGLPPLVLIADRLPTVGRLVLGLVTVGLAAFAVSLSPTASSAAMEFFGARDDKIAEQAKISLQMLLEWYGINLLCLLIAPLLLAKQGLLKRYLVPVTYGAGLCFFWLWTRDFYYYAPIPVAALTAYCFCQLPWRKFTPPLLAFLVLLPLIPLNIPQQPWHLYRRAEASVLHTPGIDHVSRWLRTFKADHGQDEFYGMLAPWDMGSTLAALSNTPVSNSQTHSARLAKLFYNTDVEAVYQELQVYGENADRPSNFKFVLIPSVNMEQKFGTELRVAGLAPSLVYKKSPPISYMNARLEAYEKNDNYYKTFLGALFDRNATGTGHFRLVYATPDLVVRSVHFLDDLRRFDFQSIPVTKEELESLEPLLRYKNQVIETSRGRLLNPSVSPEVKLFQIVPGALLHGKAEPHQVVIAHLGIKSPYEEETIPVSWKAYADSDGVFSLRVPYSTGGPLYDIPGTIVTGPKYQIKAGDKQWEAEVTEEQVQSEAQVEVTE